MPLPDSITSRSATTMSTITNNQAPSDLDTDLLAWIAREISAEYHREDQTSAFSPQAESVSPLQPVSSLPPAAAPAPSGGHSPDSEDTHPFGEPRCNGSLPAKPAPASTGPDKSPAPVLDYYFLRAPVPPAGGTVNAAPRQSGPTFGASRFSGTSSIGQRAKTHLAGQCRHHPQAAIGH